MAGETKRTYMIIMVIFLILVILYLVFLIWAYREGKWIFAPYKRPPLSKGFQPNGHVEDLTPQEQAQRKKQISGVTS